jgi:chromosome segregation ATPase
MDDNTTATFHSTASTTLNSSHHANRFAELEASIKSNQRDLQNMTKTHETMETQIIETMSTCHENTKQLVVMQGQLNNLQSTIQVNAEQMKHITNHFIQSASN